MYPAKIRQEILEKMHDRFGYESVYSLAFVYADSVTFRDKIKKIRDKYYDIDTNSYNKIQTEIALDEIVESTVFCWNELITKSSSKDVQYEFKYTKCGSCKFEVNTINFYSKKITPAWIIGAFENIFFSFLSDYWKFELSIREEDIFEYDSWIKSKMNIYFEPTKEKKTVEEILSEHRLESREIILSKVLLESDKLNRKLNDSLIELENEKNKTENLMLNIFPRSIVNRLKSGEEYISSEYNEVSILFCDIVGFTKFSNTINANKLVPLLNDLFLRFDNRSEDLGLEKIKTIGDAYMVAAGLPEIKKNHADLCADMAIGMFKDLTYFNNENNLQLELRVGINSGSVVAGVIGKTKFAYDLWGNTVNIASRMEETSLPGKIQLTPNTKAYLSKRFILISRGSIYCKGIGDLETFWLKQE